MKKIIISIVVAIILIPVIVITVSNIVTIFGYLERGYEFEKIPLVADTVERLTAWKNLVWLVLAVLLVLIFFSLIIFVFKRIKCYIRLCYVCSKEGYKFKLKRFPLTSLFGLRVKEDILIKNKEKTFCIHFIDVVGRARVFSIVNENEYNIARTTPDAPKSLGAAYYGGATGAKLSAVMSSTINSGKARKFPKFDTSIGEHIIILDPLPMEVRYIDGSVPKPLFSGYRVGNITYYEANDFIKLLKRI